MNMFKKFSKTLNWGGKQLTIETGQVARQAHGSVMVTYGETVVHCAVTAAKSANPDLDFFPLMVLYQEKDYAAGKIPGGFFKREGRPSENETLTSRLIDRPIRPLFVKNFKNETQVVATVMSHDQENNPDMVAMIGASAALTLSGLPFLGPIGGARVGKVDGKFVLNPTYEEMEKSDLDLLVAGTKQGVLMVESEAKELTEEEMLKAVTFGHEGFQPVIDMIIALAEDCAKDPWDVPELPYDQATLFAELKTKAEKDLRAAYAIQEKQSRSNTIAQIKERILSEYADHESFNSNAISASFKDLESEIVRHDILKTGKRIDGRDTKTVRQIMSEVDILPRTHGSALFTRGETQAIVVTTLGTGQDKQRINSLTGETEQHFMLHYNFPPYSVGEVGRTGSPGRREIGHGKLAWRALNPLLPSQDEFPYTIRIVSEITESNGSSSMATVCGGCLSLQAAGVPIKKSVAGIAMGLIKEGDDFAVLSDILGDEDHLGDMDFKVAGTKDGITSLQMDIKITSITKDIMEIALAQAKEGRIHILGEMAKALTEARSDLNKNAPRIHQMKVDKEKVRDVIGSGGKVIREIIEVTGVSIDIEDDGTIKIASNNQEAQDKAVKWIEGIVEEPELNKIYEGKVVRVLEFGAIVSFLPNSDGLVHISEIANERVNKVTDHVNEGDIVTVKVVGFDDRGKIRLSMKQAQSQDNDAAKGKEEAAEA